MTGEREQVRVGTENGLVVLVLDQAVAQALSGSLDLLRWRIETRDKRWRTARRPLGRPGHSMLPSRRGLRDLLPDGYDQEPEAGRFREYYEPWLRRAILDAADQVAAELTPDTPIRLGAEDLERWIAVLSQIRLCHADRHKPLHRRTGGHADLAKFCAYLQELLIRAGNPALDGALTAASLPFSGPAPKS